MQKLSFCIFFVNLFFKSCPIECLAYSKNVAKYLECLCVLEFDIYVVYFTASRVIYF